MIITFVGPESSAGALTSAEPCQHTAADELVPFFAEHLGLFHKDRLLQTHDTSVKNGKLNMLQTGEQKQQIWYGKGWPPAWHSSSLSRTAAVSLAHSQRFRSPELKCLLEALISLHSFSSLVFVSFSPSLSAQNGTAVISGTKHGRDKLRACQCSASLGEKKQRTITRPKRTKPRHPRTRNPQTRGCFS